MSTTLPNGVVIYDAADNLTPVHTTLAVLAGSLSDAIGGSGSGVRQPQIFTAADATARGNLSTTIAPLTLTEGDIADQRDTDALYRWSGSAWVQVGATEWIGYTPAWTAVTTNPAIGNGTLSGGYTRVGSIVHFKITMLAGSTTTFGTGGWRFSLPLTAYDTSNIFRGMVLDSGTRWYTDIVPNTEVNGSTTTIVVNASGGSAEVNNASPQAAWASGDRLDIVGEYRAA